MRSKVNEKTNTVVDCRVKSQNQRVIRMLERIWELDPCDGPILRPFTLAGPTFDQNLMSATWLALDPTLSLYICSLDPLN